jgi:hypothetical protein
MGNFVVNAARPIQNWRSEGAVCVAGAISAVRSQINSILKYHAIKKKNTKYLKHFTKFMKNTKIPYITTIILLLK